MAHFHNHYPSMTRSRRFYWKETFLFQIGSFPWLLLNFLRGDPSPSEWFDLTGELFELKTIILPLWLLPHTNMQLASLCTVELQNNFKKKLVVIFLLDAERLRLWTVFMFRFSSLMGVFEKSETTSEGSKVTACFTEPVGDSAGSFLFVKLLFDKSGIKNVSVVSVLSLCFCLFLPVHQFAATKHRKISVCVCVWLSSMGIPDDPSENNDDKMTARDDNPANTHAHSLFNWYGCHFLSLKSSDSRGGRDRWNERRRAINT